MNFFKSYNCYLHAINILTVYGYPGKKINFAIDSCSSIRSGINCGRLAVISKQNKACDFIHIFIIQVRESDLCVHHQYVYVDVDLAFRKQSLKMHPLTVYTGETLSLRCRSVRKRLISVSVFKCFGRSTVKRIEENSNDVFHCLYNVNKMHINTDKVK